MESGLRWEEGEPCGPIGLSLTSLAFLVFYKCLKHGQKPECAFIRYEIMNEEAYELYLRAKRAAYETNDYSGGLEAIDKAISISPKASAYWILRGTILDLLDKTEEARKSFEEAIALKPTWEMPWVA